MLNKCFGCNSPVANLLDLTGIIICIELSLFNLPQAKCSRVWIDANFHMCVCIYHVNLFVLIDVYVYIALNSYIKSNFDHVIKVWLYMYYCIISFRSPKSR